MADSVFQEMHLGTVSDKDVGTSSARVWFACGFVGVELPGKMIIAVIH